MISNSSESLSFSYKVITDISTYSNLKYCYMGKNELKLLAKALKNNCNLVKIVLESKKITSSYLASSHFFSSLTGMQNLRYLSLSRNAIDDFSLDDMVQFLKTHRSLQTFVVSNNKLTISSIIAVLNAIRDDNCPVTWCS